MNSQRAFLESLREDKLIASIKDPKSLEKFLQTEIKSAILLTGNISVIKGYVNLLKKHNRFVFLHIEKILGISHDREGLKFIAKFVNPTGIVTTKKKLIQLAKKEGLLTIQRLFLIDTDAVRDGIKAVNEIQPHALEVMPARIPAMINQLRKETNVPIITGGLIQNQQHINEALESGPIAVSTGNPLFWKVQHTEMAAGKARP